MATGELTDADVFGEASGIPGKVWAEAQRQRVDPNLALRMAQQESRFNPRAVSPKGARGVMQLMPQTAADLGVNPDDTADNIRGGVSYLAQQMKAFGDPSLAAAAYNAGPEAVRRAGGVPNIPETQDYVANVAPQRELSDAEVFGTAQPPARPSPAPRMAPAALQKPAQPVRAPKATPAAAPNGLMDFLTQLGGHSLTANAATAENIIRNLSPVAGLKPLQMGFDVAHALSNLVTGQRTPAPAVAPPAMAPIAAANLPKPQTTAGQFGASIGDFTPAALAPGSIPARIASVVLPGVASEGAGQIAHRLGASPVVEQLARTGGAVLGGAAANMRISPGVAGEPSAPLQDMRARSDAAWAALDKSQYKVPKSQVQGAVDSMKAALDEAGPELYTDAPKLLARAQAMANRDDVTVAQLNRLRSQIGNKLLSPNSTEPDMGNVFKSAIDNVILNSGDPNVAPARDLYARLKKMQAVSDAIGSADLLQNPTAAIPQKIRPLIDPKSAQRIRNLTPEEQAAARSLVKGDALDNILLKPLSTARTNGAISGPLVHMLAIPTHGASEAVGLIGAGAQAMKNARNATKAQRLLDLMSQGGIPQSAAPRVTGFDPLSDPALISLLLSRQQTALAQH